MSWNGSGSLIERLEAKFIPEPNSGCWLWIGYADRAGYGRMYFRGRQVLAHRFIYELYRGHIPTELCIDHLCRNTSCVNPDHLEPVTNKENCKRGVAAEVNRAKRLAMTHCKYGHPLSGDNLYIDPSNGQRVCRACRLERKRQHNARLPKKGRNLEGLKLGAAASVAARRSRGIFFSRRQGS